MKVALESMRKCIAKENKSLISFSENCKFEQTYRSFKVIIILSLLSNHDKTIFKILGIYCQVFTAILFPI